MKIPKRVAPPPDFKSDEEARDIIQFLWNKLIKLEDRINQNSHNSSLPPSANRPGQMAPPKRKPSGKKRGAQPGHKGARRSVHPHDERLQVEQYHPNALCSCCGSTVISNTRPSKVRQVFELPQVLYEVTEHQAYRGQCLHCGMTHQASLPDTVSQSQMGPNLLAFIALQSGQFHQSIRNIQQHLHQTFGLHFSTGAISEAQGRVSAMLTPTHQAIKRTVEQASVVYADETRHQRGGAMRWMWLSCSEQAAYFLTHYSRGQQAAKKLLGDDPTSYLVTDQYSGYRFVAPEQRQLCLAHILRNITAIADSADPENHPIGQRLQLCLLSVFRARHRWENNTLTSSCYQRRIARLHRSWLRLLRLGTFQCSQRYQGRCKLLIKDDEMVWQFESTASLPLTNNEAERTLRGYVLWRKCSYGVWSHRGELFRQRILSLVETAKRLKLNPLEWLQQITRACIERDTYPLPLALSI